MPQARAIWIILLSAVLSGLAPAGGIDRAQWSHLADIRPADPNTRFCLAVIPPELYDIARPGLSDVRITDSNAVQLPFMILRPARGPRTTTYQPTIINRVTDPNGASLATLDFGGKQKRNLIEVRTAGDNFRRAVRVEGSDDNATFFTLVDSAFVFAVDPHRRFEKIDLPDNDFRYLRLTVYPMPGEPTSPLIQQVKAFRIQEPAQDATPIHVRPIETTDDTRTNTSLYTCDLTWNHLPLSRITFKVKDKSFYRCVYVETRASETRQVPIRSEDNRRRFRTVDVPWSALAAGAIYRVTDSTGKVHQRLEIPVSPDAAAGRYVRIAIRDYDDRPLDIESVAADAVLGKILLETALNGPMTLYAGNVSVYAPRYDLKDRLSDPASVTATATIGPLEPNPAFSRPAAAVKPWTEQHQSLLVAVMVVVAAILTFLALAAMRSISRDRTA